MGEIPGPPEEYRELTRRESSLPEQRLDELNPRKRASHRMLKEVFDYASKLDEFEDRGFSLKSLDLSNVRCLAELAVLELARAMNLNTASMSNRIDVRDVSDPQVLSEYERAKQLATTPQFEKQDLANSRLLREADDPKLKEIDRFLMGAYKAWTGEERQKRKEVVPVSAPDGSGMETAPAASLRDFTPQQIQAAERDYEQMIQEVHQEESQKVLPKYDGKEKNND